MKKFTRYQNKRHRGKVEMKRSQLFIYIFSPYLELEIIDKFFLKCDFHVIFGSDEQNFY